MSCILLQRPHLQPTSNDVPGHASTCHYSLARPRWSTTSNSCQNPSAVRNCSTFTRGQSRSTCQPLQPHSCAAAVQPTRTPQQSCNSCPSDPSLSLHRKQTSTSRTRLQVTQNICRAAYSISHSITPHVSPPDKQQRCMCRLMQPLQLCIADNTCGASSYCYRNAVRHRLICLASPVTDTAAAGAAEAAVSTRSLAAAPCSSSHHSGHPCRPCRAALVLALG